MNVSVCIPTFNQYPYIEKAVRSVAAQTLPPFEIIVYDDCSTDQTREALEKLAQEISILKVVHQPSNQGISKNTDACLRAATGEIVVRLDSDDYLSPNYIASLRMALIDNPSAGYAHAAVQEVDQNGRFLKKRRLSRKSGLQSGDDALKAALKGYKVAANIIMFRRKVLEKVNYLSGRPNFGEDYHLTASISAAGYGNVYKEELLSFYRVWVDTGKMRQRRKLHEIMGLQQVFSDVIEPGFRARNWSLKEVEVSKESFACVHSDCLSWDFYSIAEKKELFHELNKLSSSPKARFYAKLYSSSLGQSFSMLSKFKTSLTHLVKKIISN